VSQIGNLELEDHGERSAGSKPKRRILLFAVLFALVAAVIAVGVMSSLSRYRHPDQAHAVFNQTNQDSTYRNERYGVTLRLRGTWEQEDVPTPSHFCDLRNNSGIVAGFWAVPTSPVQTLEQFAGSLQEGMLATGRYTALTQTELEIDGRRARKLAFRKSETREQVVVIIVKLRLSAYVLALSFLQPESGPVSDADLQERQNVMDGLAESIQIRSSSLRD
jgi:hypothetical protein